MKPTDNITVPDLSKYQQSPSYAESRIHKYVSPLKENQSASRQNDTTPAEETTEHNSGDVASTLIFNVVTSINDTIQDALSKAIHEIGKEYGCDQLEKAQVNLKQSEFPEDVKTLIQELQSLRQREKELVSLVDTLKTDQKLMKERLSLQSILAIKLKRELVNEKLAHIDSKKEIGELQTKYQLDGDERSENAIVSPHNLSREEDEQQQQQQKEQDLWRSPRDALDPSSKSSTSLLGSGGFNAFYSSRAKPDRESHDEIDVRTASPHGHEPEEASSPIAGMQPFRSSLMGQFLPSTLLDSPQIAPITSEHYRMDRSPTGQSKDAAHARMEPFSLNDTSKCHMCEDKPVAECLPCGHEVCASCEGIVQSTDEMKCVQCGNKVQRLAAVEVVDNQVEHLEEEKSFTFNHSSLSPSTSDKSSKSLHTTAMEKSIEATETFEVSPLTLSLLTEMFEEIQVNELETILKDCHGEISLAVEYIVQNHSSFNPAINAEVKSSKTATVSPLPPSGISSSNWKTELCMYYLQGKCNKTRRTCSFAHGESDLVRSTNPKFVPNLSYKTRLCPLYLEGNCPKNRRECLLAHGETDLRDPTTPVASTMPAVAGVAGAAGPPSSTNVTSVPRMQNYKTEMCYYYLKGCCNYTKEECRFAHGESDLRTVESNTLEWTQQQQQQPMVPSGGASSATSASTFESQLQQQYQYQQQYHHQQQFSGPPPPPQLQQQLQQQQQPQPQLQLQQQPLHHHPSQQTYLPLPHQISGPHHQFNAQPPPHQQQHQHLQHHLQQGGSAQPLGHMPPPPQASSAFRYMKSMDELKRSGGLPTRGSAQPLPPQPQIREPSSWKSYDLGPAGMSPEY